MSGTSLDGVDLAFLYTDGKDKVCLPSRFLHFPYPKRLATSIQDLSLDLSSSAQLSKEPWIQGRSKQLPLELAQSIRLCSQEIAQVYIQAIEQALSQFKVKASQIKAFAFHGQTLLHRPDWGFSLQIGDAYLIAKHFDFLVVHDFRSNDLSFGGEGAPLVPIYHLALSKKEPAGVQVFLNLGGVANYTVASDPLIALDCGPGNGLIDEWVLKQSQGKFSFDCDGDLARKGKVIPELLERMFTHPFYLKKAPKSLDRYEFSKIFWDWIKDHPKTSIEDGACTLVELTVQAVVQSLLMLKVEPQILWVAGGGRKNKMLMERLNQACLLAWKKNPVHLKSIDQLNACNGDAIEAEAFAYLAARSIQKLSVSFPTTTGVSKPVSAGVMLQKYT